VAAVLRDALSAATGRFFWNRAEEAVSFVQFRHHGILPVISRVRRYSVEKITQNLYKSQIEHIMSMP